MFTESFFLQLVLVLLSARFFGELANLMRLPAVIGELLAGVILGPTLLGVLEVTPIFKVLADIGVVLLLFEVGLETDLSRLKATGKAPFITALVGVAAPFFLGYLTSIYLLQTSLLTALLVGCTLTATSIGITARVLTDLKILQRKDSQIVLGAAVIDDIIGVILLAVLYEFALTGSASWYTALRVFAFITVYLILAPFVARIFSTTVRKWSKISEIPGLIPSTILSLLLIFAWVAHEVGAPELLGGFAAGLALSKFAYSSMRVAIPFETDLAEDKHFSEKIETEMKPIIYLFAPIFFVMVGVSLNLRMIDFSSNTWIFASLSLLTVAIIGKLISGVFLTNLTWISRLGIGLAMIPRGEVGLIFAKVGKNAEIIDETLFAALILVIAVTTIIAPACLRLVHGKTAA